MRDNGREETGADVVAQAPERRLRRRLRAHSGARTTTRRASVMPPSAARTRGDSAVCRSPADVRCAAQRMSAASAAWRSPRRLACRSDAGLTRSAATFDATPPTGRSAASVLASVKGKARQDAPAAPPLTSAVRAGGAVTGRDGRMAVPGPNNRMAEKMPSTVIGSAAGKPGRRDAADDGADRLRLEIPPVERGRHAQDQHENLTVPEPAAAAPCGQSVSESVQRQGVSDGRPCGRARRWSVRRWRRRASAAARCAADCRAGRTAGRCAGRARTARNCRRGAASGLRPTARARDQPACWPWRSRPPTAVPAPRRRRAEAGPRAWRDAWRAIAAIAPSGHQDDAPQ